MEIVPHMHDHPPASNASAGFRHPDALYMVASY